jgi:hypothetical protein
MLRMGIKLRKRQETLLWKKRKHIVKKKIVPVRKTSGHANLVKVSITDVVHNTMVLGTVTELRAGRPGFDSWREKGCFLFVTAVSKTDSGAHLASHSRGTGGPYPRGQAAGQWS